MVRFFIAWILMVAAQSTAQGLLPNGFFEQGAPGWNRIRFDDPAGTTGFGPADVSGKGTSQAIFADFLSPSRLSHCDWLSDSFLLPSGNFPVSFDVMWQKQNPVQVPDPSGNYIEVHLLDSASRKVFTGHIPVPRQSNLLERRSYKGSVIVPVPGHYRALISMRHSEKSNMPFRAWVDEILVGWTSWSLFGRACPGTKSYEPAISAQGTPVPGSRDWTLKLERAFAPTQALLSIGLSRTDWLGLPLPLSLGGKCQLLASVDLGFVKTLQGAAGGGSTDFLLPIPGDPILVGAVLHAQWLVADPGSASPFGVATTGGLTFEIQ